MRLAQRLALSPTRFVSTPVNALLLMPHFQAHLIALAAWMRRINKLSESRANVR
jgi:hypothetical protein